MSISFEEAQEIIVQSEEITSPAEVQKAYDEMGNRSLTILSLRTLWCLLY